MCGYKEMLNIKKMQYQNHPEITIRNINISTLLMVAVTPKTYEL